MSLWCLLLFQHGHGVAWLSSLTLRRCMPRGTYGGAAPGVKRDKTCYGLKLGSYYAEYLQAYVKKTRMY